jgi:hypothetical protein
MTPTITCLVTMVILWAHDPTGWTPIQSFETLPECMAFRENLIQMELLFPKIVTPRSRMCLPDSIDPRSKEGS